MTCACPVYCYSKLLPDLLDLLRRITSHVLYGGSRIGGSLANLRRRILNLAVDERREDVFLDDDLVDLGRGKRG